MAPIMKAIMKSNRMCFKPPKRKEFDFFQKLISCAFFCTENSNIPFLPNHPQLVNQI